MASRISNGFGRPPQDLSVTSMWSGLYAPTIPDPTPDIIERKDYPTYEIVNASTGTNTSLNSDVTTSIVYTTDSPRPAIEWWALATGTDGDPSSTYGCMDVVEVSDGYISICNLQTNIRLYDAQSDILNFDFILSGPPSGNYSVKYTFDGTIDWCTATLSTGGTGMQAASLAVDSNDNLIEFHLFGSPATTANAYSTSYYDGQLDPTPLLEITSANSPLNGCLVKRLPSGNPIWMALQSSISPEYVYPIKTVTIGNDIYVYLLCRQGVDLYNARDSLNPAISIDSSFFGMNSTGAIAKYSPDGIVQWASFFGDVEFVVTTDESGSYVAQKYLQSCGDMTTDGSNLFLCSNLLFNTNQLVFVDSNFFQTTITSTQPASFAVISISTDGILQWSVVINLTAGFGTNKAQSIRTLNGKLYVTFIFGGGDALVFDPLGNSAFITTDRGSAVGLLVLDNETGVLVGLYKLAEGNNTLSATYEINKETDLIGYLTVMYISAGGPDDRLKIYNFDASLQLSFQGSTVAPQIVTFVYNQQNVTQQYFNKTNNTNFSSGGWLLGNTFLTKSNNLLVASAFSGIYTGSPDIVATLYDFSLTDSNVIYQQFQQPPSSSAFACLLLNYKMIGSQLTLTTPSTPLFKYITFSSAVYCFATLPIILNKDGVRYTAIILRYNGSTISLYYDGTDWFLLGSWDVTFVE